MHSHLLRSPIAHAPLSLALFLFALFSTSARAQSPTSPPPAPSTPKLHIVVTIPPLLGLVKPLAPTGSDIQLLMPPGRSEHGYEFSPADLAAVAKADLLIYVGLALEPRIEKEIKDRPVARRVVLGMSDALSIKLPEGDHDHADHDHEHGTDCNHGPIDQHLWLDPKLVEQFVPALAAAIKQALVSRGLAPTVASLSDAEIDAFIADLKKCDAAEQTNRLSQQSATIQIDIAARRLITDIQQLDALYTEKLAPLKGTPIVTHHNAFSRLADRYGLVIADSIREFDNSDPTPKEIEQIVKTIREKNVSTIFIEPNYNPKLAERIAKAARVKIARLDPLGDGDWLKMMRSNLDQLTANLSPPTK